MMKNVICTLIVILTAITSYAQSAKQSIAVANPHVQGLPINSKMAAKFIQLELIKLDKYSVYDEFDMSEILNESEKYNECYGITCLTQMGKELGVDKIVSGSFDGLGNKIAISLKWIDVNTGALSKSVVREFDNQEDELQRMVGILLNEMEGKENPKELVDKLKFKNEVITSNNVGRINNSGPRVGYAYTVGALNEFASRPQDQGGLEIFPGMSMIGYQLEGQYVGTENFSALVEGIVNFTGLEQGVFIPSITVMNGFRFGKAGWEFAFGPGFGLKKESKGFFDTDNAFGKGDNYYYSESDWSELTREDPLLQDEFGVAMTPAEASGNEKYSFADHYDTRGKYKIQTTWVFAFGRTFRAGALNIPVNIFYSSSRGGGMAGASVGFNVEKKKKKINRDSKNRIQ